MGTTLRILSANLWNGRADPDRFADLVLAQAADVVCVQELSPEQAEALASVMPHGALEPARDYSGMGIALRRTATLDRIAKPVRDVRLATLTPAHWPQLAQPLRILNVHLTAPHVVRPIFGLRHRPGEVAALDAYLSARPSDQRVVVGDFNSTPLWPAYWRMRSHLTDAAVAVAERRGRRARATWGPWSSAPRLLRIDHGFVSGLTVEAFRVVDVSGSDHSAIVMDVAAGTFEV